MTPDPEYGAMIQRGVWPTSLARKSAEMDAAMALEWSVDGHEARYGRSEAVDALPAMRALAATPPDTLAMARHVEQRLGLTCAVPDRINRRQLVKRLRAGWQA